MTTAENAPAAPGAPASAGPATYPDAAAVNQAAATYRVVIHERRAAQHLFDTGLLLNAPPVTRRYPLADWPRVPVDRRVAFTPGTRTWIDADGAARFRLDYLEPDIRRGAGVTTLGRIEREVTVAGDLAPLWELVRAVDGFGTAAAALRAVPAAHRPAAAALLDALTAAGAVDASGRPVGRFLHALTKRGVLPYTGLDAAGIQQLVTDGNYRAYPEAPRLPVSTAVPAALAPLHALTRRRRSPFAFESRPLARADFDAILTTAAGVTGTVHWGQGQIPLRAYPAGGALYAVEIYPVVLAVETLAAGVYHFRPTESGLETLRIGIDRQFLLDVVLRDQAPIVAGAAALICLTGNFTRFERKYGEGSYRVLVAEAGHLSQNLILAATGLGLGARPWGGCFDALLNERLGLTGADEQVLFGILIGHPVA